MNAEEIIKELRRYGLSNGTAWGRHMGIMDIAADKLEDLNEFQGSQCENLLAQLAEARGRIAELEAETMEWISVETKKPIDLTAYGSGTQYLVTVDCCSWDKKKTMVMSWCKETIRGKTVERWKWNNRLVDSHWIVTAWMPFPPPKED